MALSLPNLATFLFLIALLRLTELNSAFSGMPSALKETLRQPLCMHCCETPQGGTSRYCFQRGGQGEARTGTCLPWLLTHVWIGWMGK